MPGGFVTIASDKAKTKARRLVPIQPNLAAWLAPYAKRSGKIWQGTASDLRDARAACVNTAAVRWKANALRHSFISHRVAATQNAPQTALEAGNSPAVIFKHYRELVRPDAAQAWFAVALEAAANVISLKLEVA